jgi:hypothetical protein
MRATIKGLVYDTENAAEFDSWSNGYCRSDFHHASETLYRTTKGNYFLHGEGGALSDYRESCGTNSWTGGARIEPMSEQEAFEWCQDRHCQSAIDAYFDHLLAEA